jgi:AAA+ ATPase superfamily predicted ATPase
MIERDTGRPGHRPTAFVGRTRELHVLGDVLHEVRASGHGAFILVKGRRRVGKSRLIEEFAERAGGPVAFFLASRQRPPFELARFTETLARSDLPQAADSAGVRFESWEAALTFASGGATSERPILIVLDEFPYLVQGDTAGIVEASINAAWERTLARRPVVLVLVGSDLSMMTMLTQHGRPLYGRPTRTLTVEPLDITEVAGAIGIAGAEAIDAYHVIGGFPRLLPLWRRGMSLRSFLAGALGDEDAPFIATGQRMLDAEFPADLQARTVLSVIGAGERTYGGIARAAGVATTNLRRSLDLLENQKRVIASERPLSAQPSKDTRYSVADSYLRFYLRFIEPSLVDLQRGRQRLVIDRIVRDWQSYVGGAIEPFVRASIERILPDPALPGAAKVGGFWTRANDPQVDLVGVDDRERLVAFVGSVKWRAGRPFTKADISGLRASAIDHPRGGVPGARSSTALVGVSRSGFASTEGLARAFGPDDLVNAWGV